MVKTRINITIERKLLKELDKHLKQRLAGISRSEFIELAVERLLMEERIKKRDLSIAET